MAFTRSRRAILPVFITLLIVMSTDGSFLFTQPSPTPPTFPDAFSVSFNEIEVLGGKLLSKNTGRWFYDFTNKRARFDHNAGQTNNFCDNQNLSPKDPKGDCQLFFTPTEDLIVYYPGAKNCCRLCGKEEGCTILKPTWLLEGATLVSVETINGMLCNGWAKKGAVAPDDTWYATASGLPCRYHEVVVSIDHNLTFVPSTFKVGPQDPSMFNVPKSCQETCPHPYKPPH